MDTETYNIFSLCITVIGFTITFIGILLVNRQLVSANRDRETDLLVRLYEISTQEPLASDFDIIWDMNADEFDNHSDSCLRACLFFEMVGSITAERYVETVLIEEYFGSLITGSFKSLSQYIDNQRKKPYNDKFSINFERLASAMHKSNRISQTT